MMDFKPGALVKLRGRDWVVLPSTNNKLCLLKPLGGTEEEITGIYLPLNFQSDKIESSEFPLPRVNDISDLQNSKILYNAARLSFRSGGGPFRSLAKLSFRPRSYQMVPLIMALKQEKIRLLIADDVGVGKTIEALLIVKELIERREIKRFAVVCLPHLCEQWQKEIKDKFSIDAVIIRSNTQARLDRDILSQNDSVYDYYPYQVISIDYIKSEQRRQVFIQECPELIIVDEAHTCARPAGASRSAQQRYDLIHNLSIKENQQLVLLTATPHSGKEDEFKSLLGLLRNDFEETDISSDNNKRKELAKFFVQRKRSNVAKWLDEDTLFPKREASEVPFTLSAKYYEVLKDVLEFARGITKKSSSKARVKRFNYWTALALLRGIMSSPAAGIEMLKNRIVRKTDVEDVEDDNEYTEEINPVLDDDYGSDGDYSPIQIINKSDLSSSENKTLSEIANKLYEIENLRDDTKAKLAFTIAKKWLDEKYNPVIFCKYIATAKYIGSILSQELKRLYNDVDVQVITSEDPDEVRKQRIDEMGKFKRRVLIATDCLSEGINLQELFTGVIHYDLPWNPNKIEQREGRVDRFGQTSPIVKTYLIYGDNNPIDGVVLKVLIRKVREIKRTLDISVPFPEDSKSVLDAVLHSVLLSSTLDYNSEQSMIDFGEDKEVAKYEERLTKEIDIAAQREKASRNIFAQNAIKANEIEEDLKQADESIGNPKDVEEFIINSLINILGVQIIPYKLGYKLFTTNLPNPLKGILTDATEVKISFDSPTPNGYTYLGRNHYFVEQLCNFMLAKSLTGSKQNNPGRSAIIKTQDVKTKTTLLLFRVRNVIAEKATDKQIVAEEMIITGYTGSLSTNISFISQEESKRLLFSTRASMNISPEMQNSFLENELTEINKMRNAKTFDNIAIERANALVDAHERFRKVVSGFKYKAVEPVLPMDLMGIYILLPDK